MARTRTQMGIAHLGVVLVIVVVFGGVSFLAWRMTAGRQPVASNATMSGTVMVVPELPSTINSDTDIKQAATALEETSTKDLDSSQLDGDLNALI